ncbi:MAG: isopenicillin N synthase family dioxygenase [Oceanobacter sp.]
MSYSHQPKTSAFSEIPVIDIAGLYSSDLIERQQVAEQLAWASSEIGFLYISGHKISDSRIEALKLAAKAFFDQPLETKMQSYIGQSSNHSGYVPEGEEQFYSSALDPAKVDHKEAYDLGFELTEPAYQRPMLGANQWPSNNQPFKSAVQDYYADALDLGRTLFRGFALALGLPEDTFESQCIRPPSQLRLVHYPYDDSATDREGIGAHTDYECFTLLLPTADGLEVLNGDGEWIDAPVKPGCFVVNIGDMLEVLSNGRFVATSHRVRKMKEERYSFPLFCALDYDTQIEPILPPLENADPDKYQPLICGEHLYAQTIQTFKYFKERMAKGEVELPKSAQGLASFGQYKTVLDSQPEASQSKAES